MPASFGLNPSAFKSFLQKFMHIGNRKEKKRENGTGKRRHRSLLLAFCFPSSSFRRKNSVAKQKKNFSRVAGVAKFAKVAPQEQTQNMHYKQSPNNAPMSPISATLLSSKPKPKAMATQVFPAKLNSSAHFIKQQPSSTRAPAYPPKTPKRWKRYRSALQKSLFLKAIYATVKAPMRRRKRRTLLYSSPIGREPFPQHQETPAVPCASPVAAVDAREVQRACARKLAVCELLYTEQSYVHSLKVLKQVYYEPILNQKLPWRHRAHVIFSNFLEILALNAVFLDKLEHRVSSANNVEPALADIFLRLAPFLKAYTKYAADLHDSFATIAELMASDKEFKEFLAHAKTHPLSNNLDLQAFLIMPVQRIPRYSLLLQSLLEHTNEKSNEYRVLVQAEVALQKLAKLMNQKIKDHENALELLQIQSQLIGFRENLLVPGRTLIKRGALNKVCRKSVSQNQFFLFSDILLYATAAPFTKRPTAFLFKRQLDLRLCAVEANPPPFLNASKDGCVTDLRFHILSCEKSFAVVCSSAEEKAEWVAELTKAISNSRKKNMTLKTDVLKQSAVASDPVQFSAAVWIPDEEADSCMICSSPFSYVWNRKHHCRACGKLVCHACSQRRIEVSGLASMEPVRSCDPCYEKLAIQGSAKVIPPCHP